MKLKLTSLMAVAYLAVLVACTAPPTGPTTPTITFNVTQNQNSQNQTGSDTGNGACAGITGTAGLTITSTTFSGGKAKVGEPLTIRVDGLQIPSSCQAKVAASGTGACVAPSTIPQTLQQIWINPTSVGTCSISVSVEGIPRAGTEIEVIP